MPPECATCTLIAKSPQPCRISVRIFENQDAYARLLSLLELGQPWPAHDGTLYPFAGARMAIFPALILSDGQVVPCYRASARSRSLLRTRMEQTMAMETHPVVVHVRLSLSGEKTTRRQAALMGE